MLLAAEGRGGQRTSAQAGREAVVAAGGAASLYGVLTWQPYPVAPGLVCIMQATPARGNVADIAARTPRLKIIGAGIGRTGTLSCKLALQRLLDDECAHMVTLFENPAVLHRWCVTTSDLSHDGCAAMRLLSNAAGRTFCCMARPWTGAR